MARTDGEFSFAALMAAVAVIAIVGIFSISRGGETSTLSLLSGGAENTLGNAWTTPGEVSCSFVGDCDDGKSCTRDRCWYPGSARSYCTHTARSGSSCDGGTCRRGVCVPDSGQTPPPPAPTNVACSSTGDCADTNSCTTDRCVYPGTANSRCENVPKTGTACTGGTCQSGVCVATTTPPPTPSILVPRVFGGQNGPSMPENGGMYGTNWTTRVTPGTTQAHYNCDTTTKCTGYTAANAGCFNLGYIFPSNPSWMCANPTSEGAALYTCYEGHANQEITAGGQTFCCKYKGTTSHGYEFVAEPCTTP